MDHIVKTKMLMHAVYTGEPWDRTAPPRGLFQHEFDAGRFKDSLIKGKIKAETVLVKAEVEVKGQWTTITINTLESTI